MYQAFRLSTTLALGAFLQAQPPSLTLPHSFLPRLLEMHQEPQVYTACQKVCPHQYQTAWVKASRHNSRLGLRR